MANKWLNSILSLSIVMAACTPRGGGESSLDVATYKLQIDEWHAGRVEGLKGPSGWLNVAGLYWLQEGINTFGAGSANQIVFPSGKISDRAGFFHLRDGVVTMEVAPSSGITVDGHESKSSVMFHPDSSRATHAMHGDLEWFVIKRDNKYGIRLRDFKAATLTEFHGIERFAVDPAWRIEATFEKAPAGKTIPITNVLGQTIPTPSPGTLVFKHDGKTYRLDALDEGEEELFVIVGDATNANETYGAGRYLYTALPDEHGKVVLDFNKCTNPPCAFTSFATCPLPPKQNVLPFKITAGEKNYESAKHI